WVEKLRIQELCSRYCHALDNQDVEGWVRCFTPDGIFAVDDWRIQGHARLRQYAEIHCRAIRCRHLTGNHVYGIAGDEARGVSTIVACVATPGGYKILNAGGYRDRLVRHDGNWLIAERHLKNDGTVENPEQKIYFADPDAAPLVGQLVKAL